MMRQILTAIVLIPALTGSISEAVESPKKFQADYRLSFLGLKIAKSTFVSKFSGKTFSLQGSLKAAGLARMFDSTTAQTSVTGRIDDSGVEPVDYVLNYVSGGKKQMTAISFRDGAVTETRNVPPLKKRGKDWVPLRTDDLGSVFDPLTASIIRASTPREVCDRTIRAYDGEMRVDLKLRYAGMKPFSTRGFKGMAVNCKASFLPVSGYRPSRSAIDFMKRKSRIEIAFAPVGNSDIYAPVTASVGTRVGTLHLYATRFAAKFE
jgi:hypothetical protein